MRVLLDTHAFVWATTWSAHLSAQVSALIADPDNDLLVSAVSAYEIDYKRDFDRELARMPPTLDDAMTAQGFAWLAIETRDMSTAARLPRHHRDPWDRIIVAQAMHANAVLVSIDGELHPYGVPVLW